MEQPKKNLGGRPTKLTEDLVVLAEKYLDTWAEDGSVIPTLEGLALSLDVAKKTLLRWESEPSTDEEDEKLRVRICHALGRCREKQATLTLNGGMKGEFNSTIAKLILSSNHGYRERSDVTTNDEPLPQPTVAITSEAVQEGVRAFEEALRPKRK